MKDPRIEAYAKLLVQHSMQVKQGDRVSIRGDIGAAPLMEEVARYVWRAGGFPTVLPSWDSIARIRFTEASDEQLATVGKLEEMLLTGFDCACVIRAPENTRGLTGIDVRKQSIQAKAYQPYMQDYMNRVRWVGCNYPCNALAQDADMSLADYADFVFGACLIDCACVIRAPENTRGLTGIDVRKQAIQAKAYQPYMHDYMTRVRWVGCNYPCNALAQDADMSLADYTDFVFGACLIDWAATEADMRRIKQVFDAGNQVHLVGPGTDLTFSIAGRQGIVCAGEKNMPDGEVFYSPVEDSAEGYITYDFPAIYSGREVDGVRLEFRQGKVINASAKKGEEFLLKMLDTDEGARYLGEFGIGCNWGIQRFSKDILFDEKIGGTVHLAVGRSYEEAGGKNVSAIHWDMIKDLRTEGRLELDGQVVQENGKFRGIFSEEVK